MSVTKEDLVRLARKAERAKDADDRVERDDQECKKKRQVTVVIEGPDVLCPGFVTRYTATGNPPGGELAWALVGAKAFNVDEELEEGTAAIDLLGTVAGAVVLQAAYTLEETVVRQTKHITVHAITLNVIYCEAEPGVVSALVDGDAGLLIATGPAAAHRDLEPDPNEPVEPGGLIPYLNYPQLMCNEIEQATLENAGLGGLSAIARVEIVIPPSCLRPAECRGNYTAGFVQVLDHGVKRTVYNDLTKRDTYDPPLPARDAMNNLARPFYSSRFVKSFAGAARQNVAFTDSPASGGEDGAPWPWGLTTLDDNDQPQRRTMTAHELTGRFRLWLAVRNDRMFEFGIANDDAAISGPAMQYLWQANWSFSYTTAVTVTYDADTDETTIDVQPAAEQGVVIAVVDPVVPPPIALLLAPTAEDRMQTA